MRPLAGTETRRKTYATKIEPPAGFSLLPNLTGSGLDHRKTSGRCPRLCCSSRGGNTRPLGIGCGHLRLFPYLLDWRVHGRQVFTEGAFRMVRNSLPSRPSGPTRAQCVLSTDKKLSETEQDPGWQAFLGILECGGSAVVSHASGLTLQLRHRFNADGAGGSIYFHPFFQTESASLRRQSRVREGSTSTHAHKYS